MSPPSRIRPPEIALCHDDEGENDYSLRVSRSEPCKPLLLSHDIPPVTHDAGETFAEGAELADRKVERDDRKQKPPSRPAILREPMWSHFPGISKDLAQASDAEAILLIRDLLRKRNFYSPAASQLASL
jgi:hypothetical protein